MGYDEFEVVDCDGHLLESIAEMAEFMDPRTRKHALQPGRNRQGVFPSLDGFHFALNGDPEALDKRRTASNHRPGSPQDWLAFLDKAKVKSSILFTSEGLSVGNIQSPRYAIAVCRAYNDYVHDRYARLDPRLRPMGLIPMQDPEEAAKELRRLVKDLGLPGAMLPSTGLPLHLGHKQYWPVYEAAADMACVLGVHGGSNGGQGLDTFTNFTGSHILHHSVPLMRALVSFVYHGVYDNFSSLRFAFLEGGCGWLAFLLDRMERDENYFDAADRPKLHPDAYMKDGRILIGCEGSEKSLAYVASRVGIEAFAYASDYPHEVDLPAAMHEIEEVAERDDLSIADRQAVLADNAKRFFRL